MGQPFCCELPRLPRWVRVSPGPAAPSARPAEGAVGGTSPVPRAGGCGGAELPHRRAVLGGRLPPWLGGCWRARAAEAGWAGGGGPAEDECGLRAGPPSEESPAELRQLRRRLPRRAAAAARSPPGGARRQQLRRRQPRQHRGEQRFVLAGAAPSRDRGATRRGLGVEGASERGRFGVRGTGRLCQHSRGNAELAPAGPERCSAAPPPRPAPAGAAGAAAASGAWRGVAAGGSAGWRCPCLLLIASLLRF